jgi:hypothetical protein
MQGRREVEESPLFVGGNGDSLKTGAQNWNILSAQSRNLPEGSEDQNFDGSSHHFHEAMLERLSLDKTDDASNWFFLQGFIKGFRDPRIESA